MVYAYTVGPEGSNKKIKPKRSPKWIFLAVFFFLVLAGVSFGTGILIAEKFPSLNNYFHFGGAKRVEIKAESQPIAENKAEPEVNAVQKEEPPENAIDQNQSAEVSPVPEPVKFTFAVMGDTQYFKPGTNGGYQIAASSIKKINPNLVFGVGDLVSSCDGGSECEAKFNGWKSVLGSFGSKAYVMQGNHDRTGKDKADAVWEKIFSYLPGNGPQGFVKFAYSFDFENSHFVVLDSEKPKEHEVNSTQRDWLERDLSVNKKENTFVFFHEPAYPVSSKINESLDVEAGERNALWNILTAHKVTAVFSGHEHIHSRRKINGVYQFVFGNTDSFDHDMPKAGMAEYAYRGQNFGIVKMEDKKITVEVYSVNGKLLNSVTFSK